jgi:undecaprenyl-diphosphatase
MVPGVSAVVHWNVSKLTRTSAAEFSFLLSYYVWRNGKKMLRLLQRWFCLTHDQINLLIIGNVIAFIVALSH